jgi:oligosaccharide repeat unit polymerase
LLVFAGTLAAAGFRGTDAFATLSKTGYSDPRADQVVGFLVIFGNVGLIVTPLLILVDAWTYGSLRVRAIAVVNLAALLSIDLLLGVRYRAFLIVAPLLLIWHIFTRARAPSGNVYRAVWLIVFAGLVFLFASLAIQISVARGGGISRTEPSVSRQLDLLTPAAATVDHVDRVGLLYGRSYLDVLRGLVPRLIWNKPEAATTKLVKLVSDPRAGVAIPLFAEAYANFGVLGVFCISYLAGWLAAGAANRCRKEGGVIGIVGLALLPPLAVQVFSRGYSVQAVQTIAFTYGVIVVVRWWSKRHTASRTLTARRIQDVALHSRYVPTNDSAR